LGEAGAAAVAALETALAAAPGLRLDAVHFAENVAGDERVVHLEAAAGATMSALHGIASAISRTLFTGATGWAPGAGGPETIVGSPWVHDTLAIRPPGAGADATFRVQRRADAFFQANRFLLPSLVQTVIDLAETGPAVDLYAGVGLFSIALAASGSPAVAAVEGAPQNLGDLRANARPYGDAIRVVHRSVEDYLARGGGARRGTVILDPPRTGLSRQAVQGVATSGARRIVYVSCDPATLARDVRALVDGGYELRGVRAFDLFPATAHVEAVATLDRPARRSLAEAITRTG
jgi:23S rRNA (uracil1939-C5)-methyltransferase